MREDMDGYHPDVARKIAVHRSSGHSAMGAGTMKIDVSRDKGMGLAACQSCASLHRPDEPHVRWLTIPRTLAVADVRAYEAPAPLLGLAKTFCTDPACPCANHRRVDVSLLAVYGMELEAFTPTESLLVAKLLPPGMLVSRGDLVAALWPEWLDGDVGQVEFALHALHVNVQRARPKTRRFGWCIETNVGRGHRLHPLRATCSHEFGKWRPGTVPLYARIAAEAGRLAAAGTGRREIAAALGCSRQTVNRALAATEMSA